MLSRFLVLIFCGLPALPALADGFRLDFLAATEVPLENPHDLKLSPDGRYLLVADVGNNRVAILDPESLAFVAAFGADHQSGTHDVDFDASGRSVIRRPRRP